MIDDLDRQLLTALALTPKRQLQLVREVETCSLTIKRRTGLLIERGLVTQDMPRGPFKITSAGLMALGDSAPRPWLNVGSISAAKAKDVAERSSPDSLTKSQAAAMGGRARAAQMWPQR